ncbi:MAG: hypothetical protein IIZ22_05345 [Clostridia bacterium]|nr:hypothetical protein [Clostridia bacterium]MBQ2499844.1 hypothetical protein [Clostridia bacterium]MBQ3897947.1 hypothetical protein [Clostridia bacterium]
MKNLFSTKKLICILLALALVLSFAGCNSHFTEESLKVVENTAQGTQYHTSVPENYQSVLKSGLYELLLDEANCAIALKDTTGNIDYSMPTVENSVGALLNVEVTDGVKWYKLNSQDNAVALGGAKVATSAEGLDIQYKFRDKAKNPSIGVDLTLSFKLEDGVLSASVDTSSVSKDVTIISIEILPTFGAVSDPQGGDFIVIPDGPGALIDLTSSEEAVYVLDTYGADLTRTEENKHPAVFGAFGLKHGDAAFAGIVTGGDAISKIKATTGATDYVSAAFSYPANQVLKVSYKFISGSAATCSSLASMCREEMVRDGMMSTRTVAAEENLPVNITITADSKNKYENAEDMVSVLKAKGINSLNLRYDNLLKKFRVQSKYGSRESLDSLMSYLSSQGFGFYVTANFFDGKATTTKDLTSNVMSFIKNVKKYDFKGYCLGDVGTILPSTESVSRQEFAESIFNQSISLSTNKSIMVDNGNLYTLKNANIVSCLPIKPSYPESAIYSAEPFVQMVLRGTVEYTSPYLNSVDDYDRMLLRCLEYGAMPAYNLTFDSKEKNYYELWSQQALDAYRTFDAALSDLRSAKMTDHKKLKDGLYVSEFNKGTYIYVNYNSEVSYYNGLTIQPMSYLRVN